MKIHPEHPEHPGYMDLLAEADKEFDYEFGIGSIDHPEFAITGSGGEPGSYYNEYVITRRRQGKWGVDAASEGVCGIVDSYETLDEAKNAIQDLARRDVKPLPFFTNEEPTRFVVADGYEVEVMQRTVESMDEQFLIATCAIFDQTGKLIAAPTFSSLKSLVDIRDNPDHLYAVIASSRIRDSEKQSLLKAAKIIETGSLDKLEGDVAAMQRNETRKVIIDGKFELFLTKRVVEVIRDPNGKKIHHVDFNTFSSDGSTVGLEEVFDLKSRSVNGYLHEQKKHVFLDIKALSKLMVAGTNENTPAISNRLEYIIDMIDGGSDCTRYVGIKRLYKTPKRKPKINDLDDALIW